MARIDRFRKLGLLGTSLAALVLIFRATAQAGDGPATQAATSQPAATKPTASAVDQSADGVKQLIGDHDYVAAVKLSSKLLSLHGKAAEGQSRFQLTMLKAEALLGTKAIASSVSTFESAVKETTNADEIMLARCTAELVRRAGSTKYTPRTIAPGAGKPDPIDLLDPDKRPAAFEAVLDDELAALQPKIKAASTSQNLPQIYPVLQQLGMLKEFDMLANGSDAKTSQIVGGLVDHARDLMAGALSGLWTRVGDIQTRANHVTTRQINGNVNPTPGNPAGTVSQTISTRDGLTADDRTELRGYISTCGKIHDAAQSLMELSKDDKSWTAVLNDSARVTSRAKDVLAAD